MILITDINSNIVFISITYTIQILRVTTNTFLVVKENGFLSYDFPSKLSQCENIIEY